MHPSLRIIITKYDSARCSQNILKIIYMDVSMIYLLPDFCVPIAIGMTSQSQLPHNSRKILMMCAILDSQPKTQHTSVLLLIRLPSAAWTLCSLMNIGMCLSHCTCRGQRSTTGISPPSHSVRVSWSLLHMPG